MLSPEIKLKDDVYKVRPIHNVKLPVKNGNVTSCRPFVLRSSYVLFSI